MKTQLVRIGNSQGVRIPKPIVEQLGLEAPLEMSVRGNALVIEPQRSARQGWDEAFKAMAEHGDDAPLLPDQLSEDADETEWRW